ncbi:MAG: patatin-like phospholipase family protein [Bacteroidota bacterium]|nr:patatin-like phospholipase family protein [Bacteroidota bacterium]
MGFAERFKINLQKHPMFRRFFYSFYFRLFLLDFKKNQFLLLFWVFFFAVITNHVARRYGVSYLFLGPEYFDKISFLSYFLTGFACGGFIMAYNIASYIKNGFRFPFIATLKNPFLKYCLNNSIIPIGFCLLYIYQIYSFLMAEGNMSLWEIIFMIISFISGNLVFVFIATLYSWRANKDINKLYGVNFSEAPSLTPVNTKNFTGQRNLNLIKESRDWYVETYLIRPFRIRLVRSVRHYKKEMLKAVLKQNYKAAFIFQIASIVTLLGLGLFSKISAFEIPAAASIFLLFTMFIMIFSSFYTWFRGWSTVIFILFLVTFNYLHTLGLMSSDSKAYGLNYDTLKTPYSYDHFKKIDKQYDNLNLDVDATIAILNKWKLKNTIPGDSLHKPKLIFINTSGGGLRSSLWTFYTLQRLDSLTNGEFLGHTQMITGSSGGMVGAAYMRELYLMKQRDPSVNFYGEVYLNNMSKDALNPIAFTVATSEWFIPLKKFNVDENVYTMDRGYSFEQKINENTGNVLNKRLGEYKQHEEESRIPMMVFSPSIVNDGRKLLISPIGISYLTQNAKTEKTHYNKLFDAVEYSRFFELQGADKTLFTSVLRMSATFPYISPIVSLPSEPRIEIMDAGLRDNYGLETTLRFIKTFNDWIAENTSGVVIVQIRDKHKNIPIDDNPSQTLSEAMTRPMGSFYGSLFSVQDYNQNQQIQMADLWCKSSIDIVDLQLRNQEKDRISLSWHLTNKEKRKVLESINLPENQEAINRLRDLLK